MLQNESLYLIVVVAVSAAVFAVADDNFKQTKNYYEKKFLMTQSISIKCK